MLRWNEVVKTSLIRIMVCGTLLLTGALNGWTQAAATSPTGSAPTKGTNAAAKAALKFDTFKVGSKTYSNVTVISRTSSDVFVRHPQGISNFKVDELSTELLVSLGYLDAAEAEQKTAAASPGKLNEVVSRTLSAAQGNEALMGFANKMRAQITAEGGDPNASGLTLESLQALREQLPQSAMVIFSVFLVAFPILYFFFCYTARLVCQKAGSEPGFLIWLPVLSLVPLLKAARMQGWMFVLFLLPVVNIFISIYWCIQIAKARGKGGLTALGLIFPVTSPFAWLYLAYSK